MNKFRTVQPAPMSGPPPTPQEVSADRLDGGLRTDVAARNLAPEESPEMANVRYERGGIEKSYGSTSLGTVAGEKILGIVEHGFYDPTQKINVVRLLRFTRTSSGQGKLELWNGTSWVQDSLAVVSTTNSTPVIVPEDYVSMVSIGLTGTIDPNDSDPDKPGKLFIACPGSTNTSDATQNGRILVRSETVGAPIAKEGDFPAGNSLTAAGQKTDVTITKGGTVVENKYTVNFKTDLTITSDVDELEVVVLVNVDGVLKNTTTKVSTSVGTTSENVSIELESGTGNNFELELKEINVTPGAGSVTQYQSTTPTLSSGVWTCDKVQAAAADSDQYTFNYDIQTEPGGGVTVNFYASADGINFDFLGSQAYGSDLILVGEQKTFTKAGLGASAKFRYEFVPSGTGGGLYSQPPGEVTWQVTSVTPVWSVSVHGFNKPVNADPRAGVEWSEEGTPSVNLTYTPNTVVWDSTLTPPAGTSPNPVPSPSFITAFGDRLIALRQLLDSQVLAASADGIAENWIFDTTDAGYVGGYTVALVDTRSDPIDPLVAAAPVTNDVLALIRERSIMRVFETGNFQIPVGVQHWIEEVGTLSPWSVKQVKGGVIFLGTDKQVYFLSEGGLNPIGEPIRLDLINATFSLDLVEAMYDDILEEYWLGIPLAGDAITKFFIFSLNKLETEQRIQWREENASSVTRPVSVSGEY